MTSLDSRTIHADEIAMPRGSSERSGSASGRGRRRCATWRLVALAALALAACDNTPVVHVGPRTPKIKVLMDEPGVGLSAQPGRTVVAQYVGWLPNGDEFLNTRNLGGPEAWVVGEGSVIAGMDDAVLGMKAGGVRRVEIPPELHWGRGGYGGVIPKDATLVFEIEVVQVR